MKECTHCGSTLEEDEWNEYYEDREENVYCSKECIADAAIDHFKMRRIHIP